MLCEKCKMHQASVFAKKEDNGFVREFYICSSCAEERELGLKFGLFGSSQELSKLCACKTAFEEITEGSYVGCQKCYQTFYEELKPVITHLHGKNHHIGKKRLTKLQILENQLEIARKNNFQKLAEKLETQILLLKGEKYE